MLLEDRKEQGHASRFQTLFRQLPTAADQMTSVRGRTIQSANVGGDCLVADPSLVC